MAKGDGIDGCGVGGCCGLIHMDPRCARDYGGVHDNSSWLLVSRGWGDGGEER